MNSFAGWRDHFRVLVSMFLCIFISTPCKPLHIYIPHSRLWIWFPFRLVCDPKLWIRISHLAPHWNVIFHCHLLFIADNQCVHWNYLHTQEFLSSHDNNFAITCDDWCCSSSCIPSKSKRKSKILLSLQCSTVDAVPLFFGLMEKFSFWIRRKFARKCNHCVNFGNIISCKCEAF